MSLSASGGVRARIGTRTSLLVPFAACFVLTVATLPLNDHPLVWQTWVALGLQVALGWVFWRGADVFECRAVALSAIVVYLGSVALLRAGMGGTSGYGALVLLPVMWAALSGRRLELMAALGGMALLFAIPLIVDPRHYSVFIWRSGALLIVLAASLGFAIQSLMDRMRGQLVHSSAILASMSEGFALTRDGEIVAVNDALCAMTGLSERDLIGQKPPFPCWPPELSDSTELLRQQIVADRGGTFELVLMRADGRRFPVSMSAASTDLGDGSRAFLTTVRDISDQRARDDALRRHADQLEAIAEVTRAVGHSDPLDAHRTICRVALQVCEGASAVSMWERGFGGQLVATSVEPDPGSRFMLSGDEHDHGAHVVFGTGEPLFVPEARTSPHCNHRIIEVLGSEAVHFQPVADASGVRGVLAINWPHQMERLPENIAPLLYVLADEAALALQRAELLARLDELTRTDQLTGLPNRRAWDDVIDREMDLARRRSEPLAVAMLDLDNFKAYNDDHGHVAGDELLQTAAQLWKAALRATDVIARWGGEEFAVLLPDCTEHAAIGLIERLQGMLPGGMTFSAGVAQWDRNSSAAQLITTADQALYIAKARGRDRIETTD